jgi:Fe-S-cluster containining protein
VSRLAELTAKIDAFFDRVEQRHGDDMQCKTGCSDCCHVRLSITAVEADAIHAYLADRSVHLGANPDHCAALDAAGRCQIYEARPVVCRSHGVPIRMREGSLPVIRNCHRNFTHTEPAADCILDQATLSTLVLAVDRAAGNDGARIDLATLLSAYAAK